MRIPLAVLLKMQPFFESISNKKLSISTLYKIFQLKQVAQEHITFYQENLENILKDCVCYDTEGRPEQTKEGYVIKQEKLEDFTSRVEELQKFLITVPEISFDLKEFDGIKTTFEVLEPILFLIK